MDRKDGTIKRTRARRVLLTALIMVTNERAMRCKDDVGATVIDCLSATSRPRNARSHAFTAFKLFRENGLVKVTRRKAPRRYVITLAGLGFLSRWPMRGDIYALRASSKGIVKHAK